MNCHAEHFHYLGPRPYDCADGRPPAPDGTFPLAGVELFPAGADVTTAMTLEEAISSCAEQGGRMFAPTTDEETSVVKVLNGEHIKCIKLV